MCHSVMPSARFLVFLTYFAETFCRDASRALVELSTVLWQTGHCNRRRRCPERWCFYPEIVGTITGEKTELQLWNSLGFIANNVLTTLKIVIVCNQTQQWRLSVFVQRDRWDSIVWQSASFLLLSSIGRWRHKIRKFAASKRVAQVCQHQLSFLWYCQAAPKRVFTQVIHTIHTSFPIPSPPFPSPTLRSRPPYCG